MAVALLHGTQWPVLALSLLPAIRLAWQAGSNRKLIKASTKGWLGTMIWALWLSFLAPVIASAWTKDSSPWESFPGTRLFFTMFLTGWPVSALFCVMVNALGNLCRSLQARQKK